MERMFSMIKRPRESIHAHSSNDGINVMTVNAMLVQSTPMKIAAKHANFPFKNLARNDTMKNPNVKQYVIPISDIKYDKSQNSIDTMTRIPCSMESLIEIMIAACATLMNNAPARKILTITT